MFEMTAGGVRVRLGFGFFAMVLFYYYLFDSKTAVLTAALSACFLHELGHLAVMLLLGEKPRAVCLYAGGMKILPPYHLTDRTKQTLILSAGCAVNLLFAGVSMLIGAEEMLRVHLTAGLLNLLPFSALDGGRLMELYLPTKVRRAAAVLSAVIIALGIRATGVCFGALLIAVFAAAAEFAM